MRKRNMAAERVKASVVRTEAQVYPGKKPRREPRLNPSLPVFVCQPDSDIAAPTGTWPNINGSYVFTDVYHLGQLGKVRDDSDPDETSTLVVAGAQVWNLMPDATSANHRLFVVRAVGVGGFMVIAESCSEVV